MAPRRSSSSRPLGAAATRSIPISQGCMVTLGAPVGFDQVGMNAWMREKVDSHSQFFKLLLRPDLPVQVAFLLLRQCLIPSMGYLARVVSPRVLASHASSFDDTVIRTATEKLGLPPSIDTAALLPLCLPIRLGGFGLRSVRLVSRLRCAIHLEFCSRQEPISSWRCQSRNSRRCQDVSSCPLLYRKSTQRLSAV